MLSGMEKGRERLAEQKSNSLGWLSTISKNRQRGGMNPAVARRCEPGNVFSEVRPTELNESDSQVNLHKIIALEAIVVYLQKQLFWWCIA